MITVSATAVRALFDIPPGVSVSNQFVLRNLPPRRASSRWWLLRIQCGGRVCHHLHALADGDVHRRRHGADTVIERNLDRLHDAFRVSPISSGLAGTTVFTGINAEGETGIGLMEVIGFAWAAKHVRAFRP